MSIREYARIQQFPDDWKFMGTSAAKYRQIGNAVSVGLALALGGKWFFPLRINPLKFVQNDLEGRPSIKN